MSWEYRIRAYYPASAQRNPGGLAIETTHIGKPSRDIEISAFRARMKRGEIAYIEVISLVEPYGITTIYE
jgi:hypothetical protein